MNREEADLLCQTGPGTPMGEMMRRYWIPAMLSEELPEPAGTPLRVRLLGEDLVAFRDSGGRVGLLDEPCSHRCTSLAYARAEEGGLRCIYHGWKYDVEGNILETPAEPAESMIRHHLKHHAYPAREVGNVLWAYMGPKDKMPNFPEWEWMAAPAEQCRASKTFQECNWAQALEGDIDSAHSDYLHSSDIRGRPKDHAPRFETEDTQYGFRYAAIRMPDAAERSDQRSAPGSQPPSGAPVLGRPSEQTKYVRITLFVAPFFTLIPPQRAGISGWGGNDYEMVNNHAYVPVDDENHQFFSFVLNRRGPVGNRTGGDGVPSNGYRAPGNPRNMHLQDRVAMKDGNWSGVQGIRAQDRVVTEGMGTISPRWKEHLGISDTAVVRFRQRMLEAVRAFMDGAEPPSLGPEFGQGQLHSDEKMVPVEWPWQAVLDGGPREPATV